jgi:hypothetical protein
LTVEHSFITYQQACTLEPTAQTNSTHAGCQPTVYHSINLLHNCNILLWCIPVLAGSAIKTWDSVGYASHPPTHPLTLRFCSVNEGDQGAREVMMS